MTHYQLSHKVMSAAEREMCPLETWIYGDTDVKKKVKGKKTDKQRSTRP